VVRWLYRVWAIFTDEEKVSGEASDEVQRALRRKVHQTLRSVGHDLESFEFNTVVSALMELLNTMVDAKAAGAAGTPAWEEAQDYYLRMLAPITPHIAEELWERNGKPYSVHTQPWPELDEEAAKEEEITLVVQVNGKLRDRITVPAGLSEEDAKAKALESEIVKQYMDGKQPKKVIVVEGKLVNIVL
jgi:leucyl-tRNA synthetase